MAKLLPPYTLCPIIDTKKLLGVSEDKDPGCVIVTLGKNMVSRYKLSDQKQVQSWTFQKKLSSPVVYDHSTNSYVGVFDLCFVGTWTDGLTQSDKLDKHWFVWMIQSILAAEDRPALVVYENGIIGAVETELPLRKKNERDRQAPLLVQEEKIVESRLVSIFGFAYVYLHVISKNDKIKALLRPVEKDKGSEIAFEVDQNDFAVCAMTILEGPNPYLVTLRSNASIYITHLTGAEAVANSGELSTRMVTTLDLINCDLPTSILTLDSDRLLIYGSAVNSEGAILAVVSLKFGLIEAIQRMKVYEPAACRMWLCHEHVVVVSGSHLVVVPFQMNEARLVSLIGKRKNDSPSEDYTRSRSSDHSLSEILENKDLESALTLFDNDDLPDDWVLSVLVFVLNEDESDVRKRLIQKVLSYPLVGDNSTLKEMRAKINLDSALKLLEILADEVESSEENKCLYDWAGLLLDSHFPQYLLSKDANVLRSVRTLYDTVIRKMPQRVPTGELSPSPEDYTAVFAADSFDLSLLPPYKEEQLFPPWSPVKQEASLVDEDESAEDFVKPHPPPPDHKLLREVLKDTSFQRRYNLIPVSVGELGTGFRADMEEVSMDLAQEEIEPVLSMAMEQLKSEIHSTCSVLGISREPRNWTVEEVETWLAWNLAQFSLPLNIAQYFKMPGHSLMALTEQDFQQRAPESGGLLYAQLELWRAATMDESTVDVSGLLQETTTTRSGSSSGEPSDDEDDEEMGNSDSPQASSPKSTTSSRGGGGSHIHLWQFLKELLASPELYGNCIRWVDRQAGVFKIEDSVRVARLWGKRKNRPAMNYDKLSRSIRQYYKKGIMKKTERSQRLVYQFCHPYSL